MREEFRTRDNQGKPQSCETAHDEWRYFHGLEVSGELTGEQPRAPGLAALRGPALMRTKKISGSMTEQRHDHAPHAPQPRLLNLNSHINAPVVAAT